MEFTPEHGDRPTGHDLFGEDVWRCIAERLALSGRELQVTQGVFDDKPEATIARELGISPHTVHAHLGRLYRKLGVSSRIELVVRLTECQQALRLDPGGGLPPLCARRAAGECPLSS